MKFFSCVSVFVLLMVISLPVTSDAFSRRSSHSEVAQTVPLKTTQTNTTQTNTLNASPQAVPEPPALFLMSIGFGLLAIGAMVKRFRPHTSAQDKN